MNDTTKTCPNCDGDNANCIVCSGTGEMPEDYEPCAECGYDHGYETAFATTAHTNMMFAMAFDLRDKREAGHEPT